MTIQANFTNFVIDFGHLRLENVHNQLSNDTFKKNRIFKKKHSCENSALKEFVASYWSTQTSTQK